MKNIEPSKNVQSAYDDQYSDKMTAWRLLGGKIKSQNILKVIGGNSFQKVLEYGAGEGSILKYLDNSAQIKELYALEISNSGIAQIKKREIKKLKEIKKFDGYQTEYAENEFDLVYCSHVIEHVEHPRMVLREIKRISKWQVFEVPLDYSRNVDSKLKHFMDYGHLNIFTPALFKFLLLSEGFVIENEHHSVIGKETLEFSWYEIEHLEKTLFRTILAHLQANKAKFARMLFGKKVSNEYYNSAYTCLTSKSGDLKIF